MIIGEEVKKRRIDDEEKYNIEKIKLPRIYMQPH